MLYQLSYPRTILALYAAQTVPVSIRLTHLRFSPKPKAQAKTELYSLAFRLQKVVDERTPHLGRPWGLLGIVLPAASADVLLKVGMAQVGMIGFEQQRDP